MKKLALLALGLSAILSGCAGNDLASAKTQIFGKVSIISEDGKDISKFCNTRIKKDGMFAQKANVGTNLLLRTACLVGRYSYTINLDALSVDVKSENTAVYFGDITVKLSPAGAYNVEKQGKNSKSLYNGALKVEEGSLKISDTDKIWSKTYLARTSM